uniref:Uncharacterized protein n=1 Tax=Arundo donax TaxID=35708 RepID=A0A0A8YIN1_ARUDO
MIAFLNTCHNAKWTNYFRTEVV